MLAQNKPKRNQWERLAVHLLVVSLLALTFAACHRKAAMESQEVSVALERLLVETKGISLAGRGNFELLVDLKKYGTRILDGNMLSGTVLRDTFYFKTTEGFERPLPRPLVVHLSSKEYGLMPRPPSKDTPGRSRIQLPNVIDQDTPDGFWNADLLFGLYQGRPSSEINKIALTHANTLLQFSIADQLPDEKVFVNDLTKNFVPFKTGSNTYRAIVTGDWPKYEMPSGMLIAGLPRAYILINDGERSVRVDLPSAIFPLKSGKRYDFEVKIDRATGKAGVQGLTETEWDSDVIN